MNSTLLQILISPDEEEEPAERGSRAQLAEKWARRAAFLEAFASDCRERRDHTTALVLEAVAQAHRSDARELEAASLS